MFEPRHKGKTSSILLNPAETSNKFSLQRSGVKENRKTETSGVIMKTGVDGDRKLGLDLRDSEARLEQR